jgi:hypothetical protein
LIVKSYSSRHAQLEPFRFELDGVEWSCEHGAMLLDLCEMAKAADMDLADPRAIVAIADIFESALGDDYLRFKQHCREQGTGPDVLMDIMQDLIAHTTARPTVPPSQSATGISPTSGTARGGSSSSDSPLGVPAAPPERSTQLLDTDQLVKWQLAGGSPNLADADTR